MNRKSLPSFGKDRIWKPALVLLPGFFGLCACGDFTLFPEGGSGEERPVAQAVVSPGSVGACESATVTMDGTGSTGENLTYSWAFTQSPPRSQAANWSRTAAKAEFKPDRAGEYKVKLTVSNAAGPATDEKSFEASSSPIASARADPKQVVVGTSGTLDGSGSQNPSPADPEDVCTHADLDFLWSLEDPNGGDASELLGETRTEMIATIFPREGAILGVYTATLGVRTADNQAAVVTTTESVTVIPGLEQLEEGTYAFVIKEQVRDTVFNRFHLLLGVDDPLGSIHVPAVTEVPYQDKLGFPGGGFSGYTLSGEVVLEIGLAEASDAFYTLSPPEGQAPGWVLIEGTSSECTVDFGQMTGTVVPQATRKVALDLTLTEVTTRGGLCALLGLGNPSDTGAIELTLEGTCQDCGFEIAL